LFDALCARLGSDLGGAVVLDLYAGTGALGLEALSRGAARAVFVETDRPALEALRSNVAALGAGDVVVVVGGDAGGVGLVRATALGPYSLLLVDPPYRIDAACITSALSALRSASALAADALVAYEHAAGSAEPLVDGFTVTRTYVYGDTAVTLMSCGE